jgi:long-chain fatty acid transport protein
MSQIHFTAMIKDEGGVMKRIGTLLLWILIGAFSGLYAAGVDLTGVGARATTLGGNYRAISNDWSGMFWNPAGLVFSKGLKAGVSIEMLKPKVGYTSVKSLAGQQYSATSATKIQNEPQTYLMPAFGVYYSNEKIAFGLGFWAPFGLGAKWDLLNTSSYNSAYPEFDFEDDLKVMALQPTIAFKLKDNLSVGAGLTLLYADIMIRKPNFTPNPYIYSTDPNIKGIAAMLPAAARTSPYDHMLTETFLDGNGMGFGANVGVQWKPVPTLSLGVSAKYYNTIALDGTLKADIYFANQAQAQAVLNAVAPAINGNPNLTAEQKLVLTKYYSNITAPRYPKMDVKADMPLPMNIGAGFAFTGISNLLISGDIAMTQWSSWDVIKVEDTNGKQISQLNENWEDGIRMGLGLEYNLGIAKARFSFYTEPRAAVNETMQPTIPDVNRRNVGIIGLGIPVGPATISLMYERMFISDYTVDKWVLTPDQSGYENMAGLYSMSVTNLMIGIDYNF